jgi:hypothetical protein
MNGKEWRIGMIKYRGYGLIVQTERSAEHMQRPRNAERKGARNPESPGARRTT